MDDKLKQIIQDIWNAGYESDISVTDEEWIKRIKEVTRVCYLCETPINICPDCDE